MTEEERQAITERRERVISLRKGGLTLKAIAEMEGISSQIVHQDIKAYNREVVVNSGNVTVVAVPEMIHQTMDDLGGIDFLKDWARKNPGEFITKVWMRLLPKRISARIKEKVEVDVFARIEQITAQLTGRVPGEAAGLVDRHCIEQSLDTETSPAPESETIPPVDRPPS